MILRKVRVGGFTGPQQEKDVRYYFLFKHILQVLSADRDFLYELLLNSRLRWAMTGNKEYEYEYESVSNINMNKCSLFPQLT